MAAAEARPRQAVAVGREKASGAGENHQGLTVLRVESTTSSGRRYAGRSRGKRRRRFSYLERGNELEVVVREAREEGNGKRMPRGFSSRRDRVGDGQQEVDVPRVRTTRPRA